MARVFMYSMALAMLFLLTACGGGGTGAAGGSSVGGMSFNMNLSGLQSQAASARAAVRAAAQSGTITSVSVTISRTGYASQTADLTVAGTTATGRVDNLDVGYWHVVADVYSGETKIYTGETDSQVVAGATVETTILFDPVEAPPVATGSLSFTVGLNPMPGYKALGQQVTRVFPNDADGKTYILDSSTGIIAVYNTDTMVRERDIVLQQVPLAVALSASKDSFFLAYTGGKVYRLSIATGAVTLVGDILTEAGKMVAVNDTYLLVAIGNGWSTATGFRVLNVATGQVVATSSYFYPMNDLVLNPADGIVYGIDTGLSPQDLHRIVVDPATGALTATDSRYHGDYYFGGTLRIINSGTRVATSSGTTLLSSAVAAQDLIYSGNLGYSYIDCASDDTLGLLYLLYSGTTSKKLLILGQDDFFVRQTIDLLGSPKYIFQTPDSIVVIAQDSQTTRYYSKIFSKTTLGLK